MKKDQVLLEKYKTGLIGNNSSITLHRLEDKLDRKLVLFIDDRYRCTKIYM
jgi:hypothetical protein